MRAEVPLATPPLGLPPVFVLTGGHDVLSMPSSLMGNKGLGLFVSTGAQPNACHVVSGHGWYVATELQQPGKPCMHA